MLPPTKPAIDTRQTPGIVFDVDALLALQSGINQVVDALRPTYGPFPHVVAVETAIRSKSPELLDSGGDIARRIIELPDKSENVGAMLVRGMLWRLHERVGDGTVTAAIMFQSLVNQGVRYLVAGGDAKTLKDTLQNASTVVAERIAQMSAPVRGKRQLEGVARAVCSDTELAEVLGEVFHVIGELGAIELRTGQRADTYYEFIQGSYWTGGLHSGGPTQRIEHHDAAIAISDLPLDEPQQLVPILKTAGEAKATHVYVIASKISEKVMALFAQSQKRDTLQLFPVRVSESFAGMPHAALEDLAALTGGQTLVGAAGYSWESIHAKHLGRARRVWADKDYFGLVNGAGEVGSVRQRFAELEALYRRTDDRTLRDATLQRLGKLLGGTAVVYVGGSTETEVKYRTALVKRTASALRAAIHSGVVPGGGATLLDLIPTITELAANAQSPEERMGLRMIQSALAAPFRDLMVNAGIDPGDVLGQVRRAGPGTGYDVRSGAVVDMRDAGVVDVAEVLSTGVRNAIGQAALALSVNAIVHRRKPPLMMQPDGLGI